MQNICLLFVQFSLIVGNLCSLAFLYYELADEVTGRVTFVDHVNAETAEKGNVHVVAWEAS